MNPLNVTSRWSQSAGAFRLAPQTGTTAAAAGGESALHKVEDRFAPPTRPTTLADLSQGIDKLSPREQDTAQSGQKVYHTVKSHFEAIARADNQSSLDENPEKGRYTASSYDRPVPTFTTIDRWSELEGPQRSVIHGFIQDEGTQAVTLPGQEWMAVARTYRDENGENPVPGGMYYYKEGDLEKAGMIDNFGKRVEVVASAQGGVISVLESHVGRV